MEIRRSNWIYEAEPRTVGMVCNTAKKLCGLHCYVYGWLAAKVHRGGSPELVVLQARRRRAGPDRGGVQLARNDAVCSFELVPLEPVHVRRKTSAGCV